MDTKKLMIAGVVLFVCIILFVLVMKKDKYDNERPPRLSQKEIESLAAEGSFSNGEFDVNN